MRAEYNKNKQIEIYQGKTKKIKETNEDAILILLFIKLSEFESI